MGIQDRDYYWEDRDEKDKPKRRRWFFFRRRPDLSVYHRAGIIQRDLPGSNLHWVLKLLVWLALFAAGAALVKYLKPFLH